MPKLIVDPVEFFFELGSIHDGDIEKIVWNPVMRTLGLYVDDLNSGFEGLPEYSGKRRALLIFTAVKNLEFNCDGLKGDIQRIYSIDIKKNKELQEYELFLRISPSGRLVFECDEVRVSDLPSLVSQ